MFNAAHLYIAQENMVHPVVKKLEVFTRSSSYPTKDKIWLNRDHFSSTRTQWNSNGAFLTNLNSRLVRILAYEWWNSFPLRVGVCNFQWYLFSLTKIPGFSMAITCKRRFMEKTSVNWLITPKNIMGQRKSLKLGNGGIMNHVW